MDIRNAESLLKAYMAADVPAFLWGAPGVGKSDLVRKIAKDDGSKLIDLRAVLLDPVDLRGLPSVEQGEARWCPPAFLPNRQRDGAEGVLFLDELNAAPPSVQAACFQLILDRKLGEYVLPKGWRIVAAGNRQEDRAAAQRMPSALANRFAHIDVEADLESWCQWAVCNGVSPMVVAFIRFRPQLLHKMEGRNLRAFPTPRAWERVSDVLKGLTPGGLGADPLRLAAVTGLVGEGVAEEFEAFAVTYGQLPNLAQILKAPKAAPLVDASQPALLFAVASGLSRTVNRDTFGNAIAYMDRNHRDEFTTLMVTDATNRDDTLKQTAAFTKWAADNSATVV